MTYQSSLCWIRRDIRLHDHTALEEALKNSGAVHLAFIFDVYIIARLSYKRDKRLTFIYDSLKCLEKKLVAAGGSLHILYGKPEEEIPRLAKKLGVSCVFSNRDYEPYAKARDRKVYIALKLFGIEFKQFKDSCVFEAKETFKKDGTIYRIFTPYKNFWLEKFHEHKKDILKKSKMDLGKIFKWKNPLSILRADYWERLGLYADAPPVVAGTDEGLKVLAGFEKKIKDYHLKRDVIAADGNSGLSPYLRHGNISIRDMLRLADKHSESLGAQVWLSEIVWRDFYMMILDTYPSVTKEAIKVEYDKIKWRGKAEHFKAWCEGKTGFPLIDAAMRHFNQTGLMHNRLRMVVASFLCKTLLLNWRLGEEYFAQKLLDFDLAANNGGWQWCASCGTDAQPYFRIFNPYTQSEKFDPEGEFIRAHCPELAHLDNKLIHAPQNLDMLSFDGNFTLGRDYPFPIVDYTKNRGEALEMYKEAVKKEKVF